MFTNILVATDGSKYALSAAQAAIHIAKRNPKSNIHIVYVFDHSKAKADVLQNWNSIETEENIKEKIKSTVDLIKTSGANYEITILQGEPGPMLVQHANEGNFDLVIVGSRGKNRLQSLILGSVSHKVAKRVKCPVLITKSTYSLTNDINVSATNNNLSK